MLDSVFFLRYLGAMNTVKEIIEAAGRENVMREFAVNLRAVQIAVQKNRAPAAWFAGLERMTGKELPRGLFSFKAAAE